MTRSLRPSGNAAPFQRTATDTLGVVIEEFLLHLNASRTLRRMMSFMFISQIPPTGRGWVRVELRVATSTLTRRPICCTHVTPASPRGRGATPASWRFVSCTRDTPHTPFGRNHCCAERMFRCAFLSECRTLPRGFFTPFKTRPLIHNGDSASLFLQPRIIFPHQTPETHTEV
jgi:hypothetical protein